MILLLCEQCRTQTLRVSDSARLATQTLRFCYSDEHAVTRALQIWHYEAVHPAISVLISAQQRLKVAQVGSTSACRRPKVAMFRSISWLQRPKASPSASKSVSKHRKVTRSCSQNHKVAHSHNLNVDCRKVARPASRHGRQHRRSAGPATIHLHKSPM